MNLSTSFLLIVVFVVIYVILINIYSVLFRLTGMTKEKSIFQSISLLTNCGYTTGESEIVVNDKTRRRIACGAMISGYVFSVVIVSLLINVFLNLNISTLQSSLTFILICCGVLLGVLIVFQLPFVKKFFDKLFEKIALLFFKKNKRDNVITLLDNYGKDVIAEVYLNRIPSILDGKSLMESKIKNDYKMNFLMFNRKGKIHDVHRDTIFQKGDVIVIFGNYQNIKDLFLTKSENIVAALEQNEVKLENELELIENYGSEAMAKIKVNVIPNILKECALFDSKLKKNHKINVMMIEREDKAIPLDNTTVIKQYDSMIVFGPYSKIKEVFLVQEEKE